MTNKTLLLLLLIFTHFSALGGYEITQYTINNGGNKISKNQYTLTSSIGQFDASNAQSAGPYRLSSGFWHPSYITKSVDLIYKNGFDNSGDN